MPYRTIQVGSVPVPILEELGNVLEPYTLANNDILNSIWICHRRNFAVGDSDVVEVPALGSAPLALKHGTYAKTNQASPVSCLLIPGVGGWTAAPSKIQASLNALGLMKDTTGAAINTNVTGVAKDATVTGVAKDATLGLVAKDATLAAQTTGSTIATDVSNAGVPLLPRAAVVVNDGAHTILTTATRSLGPFTLNRISYEIFCSFQEATLGTAGKTISLTLTFTDSVSGQIVDNVTFDILPATNSGSPHQIIIQGPTQGDTVTIDMLNNDTVTVNTLFTMLQSSRIFTHDHKFRSLNVPVFTGFTTGGNNPRAGLLCDTAPSIAAAGTATRVLSCYNGQASFVANTPVAGAGSFYLNNLNPFATNFGVAFGEVLNAPPTRRTFLINLPRAQCTVNLQNNAAGVGVYSAQVFFQDN